MTDLSESNSVEPTHLPLAVTTPIIEKQSSPIPDNASTSLQTGVKTVKKCLTFRFPTQSWTELSSQHSNATSRETGCTDSS
jgi:hypothetical protein